MQHQLDWKISGCNVCFRIKIIRKKLKYLLHALIRFWRFPFSYAPEHELVAKLQQKNIKTKWSNMPIACAVKSDIERQSEKQVSGQFTGTYVLHPFTQQKCRFIADYVLAGYSQAQ